MSDAIARPLRVLPEGQLPNDVRLQPLKDLDGYFPFDPPATTAAWRARSERVRRQLLVTLGLWPLPTRTPLNPVVHGRIAFPDYTVERVYLETLPGFYLAGNLYRPVGRTGRLPAMLCPHGHWSNGRFHDAGEAEVKKEMASGGEQFAEGGRSPLQARCVGLARMGCVVFHYDMIGYADTTQIPMEIAHGFAKQRPEMIATENWGLFSPQAESHYQSVMGLQTWNSIRALDFVLSLPDVDPQRIGVTGASGGGTQTFILGAVDDRPALAFPAVMVSTAMQGGCTCENACGLRVGTGNVEFAALFAPKPQGLTTANDWTREMATKGFPQLQAVYQLLGAGDRVLLHRGEQFGHNYNWPSRVAMYGWVNRHFALGQPEPIVERDFRRLSRAELSVWDEQHPPPPGGPDFERKLLRWLTEDTERQLAEARRSTGRFAEVYGRGVEVVVGRTLADNASVEFLPAGVTELAGVRVTAGLVRNATFSEELPVIVLEPSSPRGQTVLWLTGEGKAALFAGSGIRPEIRELLAAGARVVGADLLFQGESATAAEDTGRQRKVKNPREAAAYTYGYNHSLFAQRAHDVLTLIRCFGERDPATRRLSVAGVAGAGPWVAAARAVAGQSIHAAAVDTGGFRFLNVKDIYSPDFLPGGAKYGDLPGMLAVGAPGRLWVTGETTESLALVREQYRDAAGERLAISEVAADPAAAAAAWLARQ
ncbi:MAG: acetylxylan esterase [Verrucomicrobia bacterium]|nr:acetylxylan esterase [Verrucomicrobiota bacterium]